MDLWVGGLAVFLAAPSGDPSSQYPFWAAHRGIQQPLLAFQAPTYMVYTGTRTPTHKYKINLLQMLIRHRVYNVIISFCISLTHNILNLYFNMWVGEGIKKKYLCLSPYL